MLSLLKKIFGSAQQRTVSRFWKIVQAVNREEERLLQLSDEQLRAKTTELRTRYQKGETLDQLLPEAYAAVKVACRRLTGTEIHVSGYNQLWDMVPYDVQIVGAIALHKGHIAEMMTGEGKTLTATLPLYLNALTGQSVHLVTVNDYLVKRDCEWTGSILRFLGLTTGALTNQTSPAERKEIYKCDVVYGTASEFGFDYLRDNSMSKSKEEQVQRGYAFAIVDEIDSILIDEARTPLIISGPTPRTTQMYGELRQGIGELVQKNHEICNRLANEARKVLEPYLNEESLEGKEKKELEAIRQACRKLWIVSKGMPNHKVVRRTKEQPDLRSQIDAWDVYYHNEQNKKEKAEAIASLCVVVDEKGNEFELTDRGITTWGEIQGGDLTDFEMLDLGGEYALIERDPALSEVEKQQKRAALADEDMRRKERSHNIRQLVRAHLLMERDVDYIIDEGKIVIIDENTGRPQPGRRFSDGLHQAIEAKEGLSIQRETQTYATITLQNYFRMYKKLAGMTGTAITEANEFKEIYKLDVLQIPTYKPSARLDANDEVYMTEREKYHAILKEVREIHAQGRPILIGTESVEVSEKLSRILKQNQIPHTVLNARHHEKEAEIIAEAGSPGAVTVATNMAGRGTDIKLKPEAAAAGGLHVIGTTRHQSRRIDRQLRGRSGRLGDKGSSKFFISFEDPLMRLFASPRITTLLKRFRPPEGEAISAGILNRSIETAQKRVEGRNYTIRKYTLEYDDVMNKQRQEVYNFRNEVLHHMDLRGEATKLLHQACSLLAPAEWNSEIYRAELMSLFPVTFPEGAFDDDHRSHQELIQEASQRICQAFQDKLQAEQSRSKNPLGPDPEKMIQEALRHVIIDKTDELWQEHLLTMDYLRAEVNLRTVGGKDPLLEFKHEAFRLFHELTKRLHLETARNLFKVQLTLFAPHFMGDLLQKISLETNRLVFDAFTLPTEETIRFGPEENGEPSPALP